MRQPRGSSIRKRTITSPKSIGATPLAKPAGKLVKVRLQQGTTSTVSSCCSSRMKTTPRIGPSDRAQPADDNHADVQNRIGKAELLGVQGTRAVGQQRPGDAGEETADEEGQQLVVEAG